MQLCIDIYITDFYSYPFELVKKQRMLTIFHNNMLENSVWNYMSWQKLS